MTQTALGLLVCRGCGLVWLGVWPTTMETFVYQCRRCGELAGEQQGPARVLEGNDPVHVQRVLYRDLDALARRGIRRED